jgi:hypothetical protein
LIGARIRGTGAAGGVVGGLLRGGQRHGERDRATNQQRRDACIKTSRGGIVVGRAPGLVKKRLASRWTR